MFTLSAVHCRDCARASRTTWKWDGLAGPGAAPARRAGDLPATAPATAVLAAAAATAGDASRLRARRRAGRAATAPVPRPYTGAHN